MIRVILVDQQMSDILTMKYTIYMRIISKLYSRECRLRELYWLNFLSKWSRNNWIYMGIDLEIH